MKLGASRVLLSLGLLTAIACGGSGADPGSGDGTSPTGPGGPSPAPTTSPTSPTDPTQPTNPTSSKIQTVFVILMENHSWSTIKASASASYINGTLVPMGAHAEQYYTPAGNHPSEPNYIWLEAGDNLSITNDDAPSKNHQSTTDHLTTQLDKANISWKAYAEGITAGSCPLSASGTFDPKHTPQLYFDDVTNTNDTASKSCIDHVRPFSELATDIASGKVARYNFITPDLCNDMHGDGYNPTNPCSVLSSDEGHIKLGDDWLKANVPALLGSKAYKDGGAIFIVWDEGDEPLVSAASDGPIGMIVLSPKAKAGLSTSTKFTHSSALRTFEAIFGVPYLRGAQTSNDLSEMFTSFP